MRCARLVAAWGVGCLLLLTACGGKHAAVPDEPALKANPGAGLAGELPPLPAGRETLKLKDLAQDGAAALSKSANTLVQDSTLKLNAGAGEAAFGIWGWDVAGRDPLSVEFNIDVPAGGIAFFALADYAAGRWELRGPLATDVAFALDGARHVSPGGRLYVAALAWDNAVVYCRAVTLTIDTLGTDPPTALLVAQPQAGHPPLTVEFDAHQSFDPDGTIADQAWDLDGDGVFGNLPEEQAAADSYYATYTYNEVGEHTAWVRVTDDNGNSGSDDVVVSVVANQPPVAALATYQGVMDYEAPAQVSFRAGGSQDPDGKIDDYEWDFDGDGQFSATQAEQDQRGDSFPINIDYAAIGEYTVNVRVTDDEGLTDEASVAFRVHEAGVSPLADLTATPGSGATPLTVTLDASGSIAPDGTELTFAWDFDSDGRFDEPGAEAEADGLSTTDYMLYSAGTWGLTVRAIDTDGDTDEAVVQVTTTGNMPPAAVIEATPTEGEPPLTVAFAANASDDPDGTIADYEWDLDADGLFSETGSEADAGGLPFAQFVYEDPGLYSAAVRVTDNSGGASVAVIDIMAYGWIYLRARPYDGYVFGPSLAVIDGCPAISYVTFDTDDYQPAYLHFAYSTTPLGTRAWEWYNVAAGEVASSYYGLSSMAEINGAPAIACFSEGSVLGYFHSSTADGRAPEDWQTVIADSENTIDGQLALAQVAGRPAIAYNIVTGQYQYALNYALSSTVDGGSSADWQHLTLIPEADGGPAEASGVSLALVDGKPAIAYRDTQRALCYAFAGTADGSDAADWASLLLVPDMPTYNSGFTLGNIAGRPAIAYGKSSDLAYASSSTAQGALLGDWSFLTIDDERNTGAIAALGLLGGKPAIAYREHGGDWGLGYLWLATSATAGGDNETDWTCEPAISSAGQGSFAEINGCPAIAFIDDMQSNLYYAIKLQ